MDAEKKKGVEGRVKTVVFICSDCTVLSAPRDLMKNGLFFLIFSLGQISLISAQVVTEGKTRNPIIRWGTRTEPTFGSG